MSTSKEHLTHRTPKALKVLLTYGSWVITGTQRNLALNHKKHQMGYQVNKLYQVKQGDARKGKWLVKWKWRLREPTDTSTKEATFHCKCYKKIIVHTIIANK